MKTAVLIFCTGSELSYKKALKKELKDYEIITFKYKKTKGLKNKDAEEEEAKARNRALLELECYKNLILLDESEFIFKQDALEIEKALENGNSMVLARRILYAGTNSCYLHDSHAPVVGVNPRCVRFYLKRCGRADSGTYLNNVTVHDFSVIENKNSAPKQIYHNEDIVKVIKTAQKKIKVKKTNSKGKENAALK
nr:hypothetical protein 18 [bacterium]